MDICFPCLPYEQMAELFVLYKLSCFVKFSNRQLIASLFIINFIIFIINFIQSLSEKTY